MLMPPRLLRRSRQGRTRSPPPPSVLPPVQRAAGAPPAPSSPSSPLLRSRTTADSPRPAGLRASRIASGGRQCTGPGWLPAAVPPALTAHVVCNVELRLATLACRRGESCCPHVSQPPTPQPRAAPFHAGQRTAAQCAKATNVASAAPPLSGAARPAGPPTGALAMAAVGTGGAQLRLPTSPNAAAAANGSFAFATAAPPAASSSAGDGDRMLHFQLLLSSALQRFGHLCRGESTVTSTAAWEREYHESLQVRRCWGLSALVVGGGGGLATRKL
eukprot:350288-Chlamydomonas_euryale.AAC.7